MVMGLDLGTASVRVAVATGSQANLLAWPEGPVCPAALSVSGGTVLYGKAALERVGTHGNDTVVEPLTLVGGPGAVLDGHAHSAEQLIAWWFDRALATVLRAYPEREPRLVTCVPWEAKQVIHPAMVSAASRSGVQLLTTVQSTTAAAVGHASITGQRDATLLVVDVGAHRLEAAMIRMQGGKPTVLGRACERMGGASVDDALAESCLREMFPGLDIRRIDLTRRALLRIECERVRRVLGEQQRTMLRIQLMSGSGPGSGPVMEVTRRRLDDLTKPLKDAVAGAVRRVQIEVNLKPQDINDIIAVGGMAHATQVGAAIREVTGRTATGTDIDGAAARGAAIIGAMLCATATSASQPPRRVSEPLTQVRPGSVRPANPAASPSSPPFRSSPSSPPIKESPTQPAMRSVSPPYVRAPVSPTGETMPAMQAQSVPSDPVEVRATASVRVAEAIIPSNRRVPQPYSSISASPRTSRSTASRAPGSVAARPMSGRPTASAPRGEQTEETQGRGEGVRQGEGPPAHPTLQSAVMEDPSLATPVHPSVEMVLGAARVSTPPLIQDSGGKPAVSRDEAASPGSPEAAVPDVELTTRRGH